MSIIWSERLVRLLMLFWVYFPPEFLAEVLCSTADGL